MAESRKAPSNRGQGSRQDRYMQGKIVKGIAGFYYVHVVESGVYECKAKGAFRKEKIKPLVGDNVIIEVLDEAQKTGNIKEVLKRKNEQTVQIAQVLT